MCGGGGARVQRVQVHLLPFGFHKFLGAVRVRAVGAKGCTSCLNHLEKDIQIDKFSDLKTLNINKETKIYRHSWKQRAKISITAKFEEEIL